MSMISCPGCGTPVAAHVQFCTSCGVRIGDRPSDPAVATTPIQPSSPPAYQPQVAPAQVVTAPQPYLQPPSRRNETRRLVLIGVSALLVTLIIRIALAAANTEPEGELVAELPVGPEGGSAEFDDGGKLTVPKGALAKQETITVRRRLQRQPIRGVSPGGGPPLVIPAGTVFVYFLGPIDIQLLRPITLTLPALSGPGAGLIFVSANGQVTFLQGVQRGRNITVQLSSLDFSQGQRVFINQR